MWIKGILCTQDAVYAERLVRFLDRQYGNKIELNVCSSMETLLTFLSRYKADLLLFGEEFAQEAWEMKKDLPCTCAVLAEQMYETGEPGFVRIEKFRKGDRIYRSILDAYSSGENVKRIHEEEGGNAGCKIYAFVSAMGGSGTSTIARAYARKCAGYEKVLYLDMGLFRADEKLEGNPNGMDEIILALKSRRDILSLKLAGAVAGASDRVYTYGPCRNPADLLELNAEEIHQLFNAILAQGEYGKVVIDIGSSFSAKEIECMKRADMIVYVLEEKGSGKQKYEKFCAILENIGKKEQMRILRKVILFRNKVRQDYGGPAQVLHARAGGWAPLVSMDSDEAVIDRLAQSDSFRNLEMRNAE